jgi:sporulation protein YlmC with PRC-barrel domain
MCRRLHGMIDYSIRATNGDIGKVVDFYFDDANWIIRYMGIKTGQWLSGHKVLISLTTLDKTDWESKTFSMNLTCAQVNDSPDIDRGQPLNLQHEVDLDDFYHMPLYWEPGNGSACGIASSPLLRNPIGRRFSDSLQRDNPQLRSTRHLTGYNIHATDGEIGHVENIIIDIEKWVIDYMVIDAGNWLPGKKILISPQWVKNVNWADANVYLDRSRKEVQQIPEFDDSETDSLVYEGVPS